MEAEPPGLGSSSCRRIRLGHAYWNGPASRDESDLREVIRILSGGTGLRPRDPADPVSVLHAEDLLGSHARLIYAFSGCLHPKLGTIGLIVSPAWLDRSLHGVSRCDTGGLAGRRGAFSNIMETEVKNALYSVSFGTGDAAWESEFSNEIVGSYATERHYVAGDVPDHVHWKDVRSMCIDRSGAGPDRRLWTWEMRFVEPPEPSDFEGLVLSPEAFKRLEELRRAGIDVPDGVRVIHGVAGSIGVHYFQQDSITDLLCGA